MKVDYLDLRVRYEASGLTQKAFAKQEGLSANMLSYYLKWVFRYCQANNVETRYSN